MKNNNGKPFIIILLAVLLLAGLSFAPWSRLTDGKIKDFNLIGYNLKNKKTDVVTATEQIDPELEAALTDNSKNAMPLSSEEKGETFTASDTMPSKPKPAVNPRVGDVVIIEDYTADGTGLKNLKTALANRASRPARIAVIGDSYIEGDILTMNVREALQNKYGGCGVGFIPLSSPLTGFRTSVRQTCSGWTVHDMRKKSEPAYKWLAGEWCTASAGAKSTFKGVKNLAHLADWQSTQLLYVSPADGNIKVTIGDETKLYPVKSGKEVQAISINRNINNIGIETDINGLQALGIWLDGNSGICVDNMSLRGNSGISHRFLDNNLCAQMNKYIKYDCIIVEYGINALSSQQSNYNGYANLMTKVIAKLRQCYPGADIIMMGIGDRGQKYDGVVSSLPTAVNMVDAQRSVARKTGVLFWDNREAMGGENAVVTWRNDGLINADYIHLNAKGGARLSKLFVRALEKSLDQ